MASEADDSLFIEVELGLAKADQDFDALKRRIESTPIRVTMETANTAAAKGSTFGGQQVLTGPANLERPETPTAQRGPSFAEQQQLAYVNRLSTVSAAEMGGFTGQAPFRPVPTANRNSVYGSVGYERQTGEYGSTQPLPNTPERAAPTARTVSSAAMDLSPEIARAQNASRRDADDRRLAAARYSIYESRAAEQGFVGPLRSPADFATRGGAAEAREELRQARRTMSAGLEPATPTGQTGGGIDALVPTGLSALYSVGLGAERAVSLANDLVVRAQVAGDRNRLDPTAEAADAAYQDARSTTGFGRSVGGLLNTLGGRNGAFSFIDEQAIDDARDTAMAARAAAKGADTIRDTRRVLAENALIGSTGFAAELGSSRIATNEEVRSNNLAARENRFASADLTAKNNALRSRQGFVEADLATRLVREAEVASGAAGVAGLQGANDTLGAGLASLANGQNQRGFELERSLRGLVGPAVTERRQAEAERNDAERAAFTRQYNRASDISTQVSLGATGGDIMARMGDAFGGRAFAIREQNEATLRGLPSYDAYLRDPNSVSGADRQRIEAERVAGQNRLVANEFERQRVRVGAAGAMVAGNLDLNFQGTEAAIAANETQYRAATVGMARGTPDEVIERDRRDLANRQVVQQSRLAQQSLGYSLGGESRSLDYALARNVVGAQAASIAASGINRFQAIRQRGEQFADEAERARQNSIKELDVLRQNYAFSFRAEQFDAQNVFAGNPRDAQDPTAAFGAIGAAQYELTRAKADEGRDDGVKGGETEIGATSINGMAAAFAKELDARLAR